MLQVYISEVRLFKLRGGIGYSESFVGFKPEKLTKKLLHKI